MNWKEAVKEARENLGLSTYGYIEKWDWDAVVDEAKLILKCAFDEERFELREDAHFDHQAYLNSPRWKELRMEVLTRDHSDAKIAVEKQLMSTINLTTAKEPTMKYLTAFHYAENAITRNMSYTYSIEMRQKR